MRPTGVEAAPTGSGRGQAAATLVQRSLAGVRWSAAAQLVAQAAQYGAFLVLARTLAPAQYGTLASAMLVMGLVAVVQELGLGAALIQRPALARGHLAACLWANMAAGLALATAVAAGAPAIAAFFQDPRVADVLRVLALGFPLAALGVLPRALLERDLRFKALGVAEAGAAVANGGLAIGLALGGAGVWAMVAGALVGTAGLTAGLWAIARPGPGWRCTRADLRDLLAFGGPVWGARLLGYLNANVDYMIVGRMMGPAALGVYALAYKLVTWPMLRISHVVLRVAFPAFARLQDDEEAFARRYVQLVGALAMVVFPLLAGLAAVAPELLPLAFGPQWGEAVLPTQLLCAAGALKAMVCSIGTVFMGKGRPDLELKLNAFGAVKLPLFLLAGTPWGVPGVATALLASSLTGVPVQQHVANRLLGLSWGAYLRGLAAPAGAAAAMLLALAAWRLAGAGLGPAAWLAVAVPLGAVAYAAALPALGMNWLGMARRLAGRRGGGPSTGGTERWA